MENANPAQSDLLNHHLQTVHQMDFQKLLLAVARALSSSEVKALGFLCIDLLDRNVASVESATDLFSRLVDQDHLSPEQPHLLAELLFIIKRNRLLLDVGLTHQESTEIISPYRKLLYNLSEDLKDAELKNMKFLLKEQLSRRKQDEKVTTLEVFLELERKGFINDTKVDLLVDIIQAVCPVLIEKIKQFQEQLMPQTSPASHKTGQARSMTYSFPPRQVPQSLGRKFPGEMSAEEPQPLAQPNMSSSRMDLEMQYESLSNDLSGLNTETNNCASFSVHWKGDDKVLGTYAMTAPKRGICLIVNNYDFTQSEKNLTQREGTMIDEECLQKVFKWLDFEVETHRDCKSDEMLSVVQELGSRDHSKMDCLVCCILSHGEEGRVYGVDGHTISIRDLMQPFNGVNCSSLAKKPKLFFIQACQGSKEQRAVSIEADGPAQSLVHSDAIEAKESIPSDADFLLGMATIPSFVSFRERKNGTWYIQSLCQNLIQMVPRCSDLVSILTKVNADVSQRTDSTGFKKQMPQPAFSLTKKVIFPNPKDAPPSL